MRPHIGALRVGGVAQRSDCVCEGDFITAINGASTNGRRHDEVVELLRRTGNTLVLTIEYPLPPLPESRTNDSNGTIAKTLQVRLQRDASASGLQNHRQITSDEGFGFIVRGGKNLSPSKPQTARRGESPRFSHSASLPLTVVDVRPNGAADREGSIRVGDRILAVNSVGLQGASLEEFQRVLDRVKSDVCVVLIEYDVAQLESVVEAKGPILVEMEKDRGRDDLGITLGENGLRVPDNLYIILMISLRLSSYLSWILKC